MVSIMSVADSPRGANSTGNIYFYLLNIDYITHDLQAENKLTAMFSNDQDLACTNRGLDPMEPTCSRVMITGYIAQVQFAAIHMIDQQYFTIPKMMLSGTEQLYRGYNRRRCISQSASSLTTLDQATQFDSGQN